MKKVGTVIIGFLIVLGAMLIREVVAAIEMFGYSFYKIMSGAIEKEEMATFVQSIVANTDLLLFISAVGMCVWIVVFGILYNKSRKSEGKALFEGKLTVNRVLILCLMGIGLQFFINSILGSLIKVAPTLMESYAKVVKTLGMGNSLTSLLFVGFIAPIGEELVFRGITMNYLQKHLSFVAVNIVQAVFFGLYHLNVVQGIYAFVLGLILGWIVKKYGSIREAILLHMAVNLSGCLVGFIMPEKILENWIGLGLLLMVSICLLAFSGKIVKMEEVEIKMIDMVE